MITRPLSSKGQASSGLLRCCGKMIALLLLSTYRNRDNIPHFPSVAQVKGLSLFSIRYLHAPIPSLSFPFSNQLISRFENVCEGIVFRSARGVWHTTPQITHEKSTKSRELPQTLDASRKAGSQPLFSRSTRGKGTC
jgi:hypothetical protein